MTPERRKQAIEALGKLVEDASNDAMTLEGKPFIGATVGTHLGQIYASIYTLGRVLQELVDERDAEALMKEIEAEEAMDEETPEQAARRKAEEDPSSLYADGRPKMHRHFASFDVHRDDQCPLVSKT